MGLSKIASRFSAMVLIFPLLSLSAFGEAPYEMTWVRQLGTTTFDKSYSVAAGSNNQVYVGGFFVGKNLLSYDAKGDFLWAIPVTDVRYGTPAQVSADAAGNVFLREPTWDLRFLQTDQAGNLIWEQSISIASSLQARSEVDNLGRIYYTTRSSAGTVVSKLNTDGTTAWARLRPSSSLGDVAVDDLGHVYSADRSAQVVTKWDSDGNELWSKPIPSAFLTTDMFGNLITTGYPTTNGNVSKYDPNGNLIWKTEFGPIYWEFGADPLTTDAAGNVFVTGVNTAATALDLKTEAVLIKIDATGGLQWRSEFGTSANDLGYGVAADSLGNVYVTGITFGDFGGPNQGYADGFLAKFTVPEPTTLVLLLIGAALMARSRNAGIC